MVKSTVDTQQNIIFKRKKWRLNNKTTGLTTLNWQNNAWTLNVNYYNYQRREEKRITTKNTTHQNETFCIHWKVCMEPKAAKYSCWKWGNERQIRALYDKRDRKNLKAKGAFHAVRDTCMCRFGTHTHTTSRRKNFNATLVYLNEMVFHFNAVFFFSQFADVKSECSGCCLFFFCSSL